MLKFRRLPPRALKTIQHVLDVDPEFRERVADGVNEDDVDRPSWLYLARPEGWEEELSLLRAIAFEEAEANNAAAESRSAVKQVEHLSAKVDRLREGLREALARAEAAESALEDHRRESARADHELARLHTKAEELEAARSAAVRGMKEAEARDRRRLESLRSVENELAEVRLRLEAVDSAGVADQTDRDATAGGEEPTDSFGEGEPGPLAWANVDPGRVAAALDQVAVAIEASAVALGRAGELLVEASQAVAGSTEPVPEGGTGSGADESVSERSTGAVGSSTSAGRPPRRSPLKLVRGVLEGSPEGIGQILGTVGIVVYVDGYNVSMEAWPTLDGPSQRSSLVDMLATVVSLTRSEIHVVFDGIDEGGRPTVSSPLPVRVHFSREDTEADDLILRYVAELPTDRPCLVVSSDQRVRTGATRLGANTVRSGDFLVFARGTRSSLGSNR